MYLVYLFLLFFFNDTAPTEIYTLSLHDALPIFAHLGRLGRRTAGGCACEGARARAHRRHSTPIARANAGEARSDRVSTVRSEEHTSELQSQFHLVCRLLLEKKKKNKIRKLHTYI